jgi:hypothetical protein
MEKLRVAPQKIKKPLDKDQPSPVRVPQTLHGFPGIEHPDRRNSPNKASVDL